MATPSFALSAVPTSWTLISSVMSNTGRPGGNRTPNLRFWIPPLCQLSYWPVLEKERLLQNLRDDAGTDGAAALADRKAQPLFHRDRADQLHVHLDVVPGHDHLHPRGQLDRAGHIGRAEVKLRPIPLEEGRMPASLLLGQHVHLRLKVRVRGDAA